MKKCLDIIQEYYKDNPYAFETYAINKISKMDLNFIIEPIRRVREGGRDGIGVYQISTSGTANYPLKISCSIETKHMLKIMVLV